MKLIIDIPEKEYNTGQLIHYFRCYSDKLDLVIYNGTPLPECYGRLIDADKCIKQAWNDFYKHEDEWEKKDPDYVGVKRFYDQNGFECCLKTIGESPTIIEADTESEDNNENKH